MSGCCGAELFFRRAAMANRHQVEALDQFRSALVRGDWNGAEGLKLVVVGALEQYLDDFASAHRAAREGVKKN